MNYDFTIESPFPNSYSSAELFDLFQRTGLFDHLSKIELTKAEKRAIQLPDETPLLPVFVLLSAAVYDVGSECD